jgi:hypothetical protein
MEVNVQKLEDKDLEDREVPDKEIVVEVIGAVIGRGRDECTGTAAATGGKGNINERPQS